VLFLLIIYDYFYITLLSGLLHIVISDWLTNIAIPAYMSDIFTTRDISH
jgi:hypothetical protein